METKFRFFGFMVGDDGFDWTDDALTLDRARLSWPFLFLFLRKKLAWRTIVALVHVTAASAAAVASFCWRGQACLLPERPCVLEICRRLSHFWRQDGGGSSCGGATAIRALRKKIEGVRHSMIEEGRSFSILEISSAGHNVLLQNTRLSVWVLFLPSPFRW